jgi:hypothetical protein
MTPHRRWQLQRSLAAEFAAAVLLLSASALPSRRQLRTTVLAVLSILGVALSPPVASAQDPHGNDGGARIAPASGGGLTGDELLGEVWAQNLALPASNDPFDQSCIPFARNVIAPHPGEPGIARCNATPRTRLFVFFGSFYSNLDPPFPTTEEAQLAAAVADDQAFHELNVTVDDGHTVNLVRRRYELFSPQRTVQLSDDNFYGVPAQTITFTAHAWGAVIRDLRPGRHKVTFEVVSDSERFTLKVILNVARGGHSDHR